MRQKIKDGSLKLGRCMSSKLTNRYLMCVPVPKSLKTLDVCRFNIDYKLIRSIKI
jgi:hypothetical protein